MSRVFNIQLFRCRYFHFDETYVSAATHKQQQCNGQVGQLVLPTRRLYWIILMAPLTLRRAQIETGIHNRKCEFHKAAFALASKFYLWQMFISLATAFVGITLFYFFLLHQYIFSVIIFRLKVIKLFVVSLNEILTCYF